MILRFVPKEARAITLRSLCEKRSKKDKEERKNKAQKRIEQTRKILLYMEE